MANPKEINSESIHDFTEETKDRYIRENKGDKGGLLIIHVRGAGKMNMKREQFLTITRDNRIRLYLIADIKYFKNKNFRAQLIFIKWLD